MEHSVDTETLLTEKDFLKLLKTLENQEKVEDSDPPFDDKEVRSRKEKIALEQKKNKEDKEKNKQDKERNKQLKKQLKQKEKALHKEETENKYLLKQVDLLQANIDKQKIDNSNSVNNINLRNKYATYIFLFVCTYMLLIIKLVYLDSKISSDFFIDENVLIALLTTTTANVIGLIYIIMKYIFQVDRK